MRESIIVNVSLVTFLLTLIIMSGATTANEAFASVSSINLSITTISQSFSLDNIETKKVRVGDIDIAYKIFGKGKPLLLIPGFSMTMDMWDPNMLTRLSLNHTVIVFDNRGIGQTTAGNDSKEFSIAQFANDTAGFLVAMKLDGVSSDNQPIDILGLSLGGFIAQEFALTYPDKVDRLILLVSSCGGKESTPPQLGPKAFRSMVLGNAAWLGLSG